MGSGDNSTEFLTQISCHGKTKQMAILAIGNFFETQGRGRNAEPQTFIDTMIQFTIKFCPVTYFDGITAGK